MPNKTIYVRKVDEAIFDKVYTPDWLHEQLQQVKDKPEQQDLPASTVRVLPPKPPEMSDFRWQQHLMDSGLLPVGYDKVMGDPSMFDEPTVTEPEEAA